MCEACIKRHQVELFPAHFPTPVIGVISNRNGLRVVSLESLFFKRTTCSKHALSKNQVDAT